MSQLRNPGLMRVSLEEALEGGNSDCRNPRDLSAALGQLQRDGYLVARGATRGKCYFLPGDEPHDELALSRSILGVDGPEPSGETTGVKTTGVETTGAKTTGAKAVGAEVVENTTKTSPASASEGDETTGVDPAADSLSPDTMRDLQELAAPIRGQKRPRRAEVERLLLLLCQDRWLLVKQLAELLMRDVDWLRKNYLTPLVEQGKLRHRYPSSPRHSPQAYQTVKADHD